MAARFPRRSAAQTGRAVVDLVRSAGVVSRVELAELSGLTGASISRTVKRLLDDGLLVEVGQSATTGGKPRTLLELNTRGRYAVGISLDEVQLTYVLVNLRGEVVDGLVSPGSGSAEPGAVVARMAAETTGLLQRFGVDLRVVTGIGVALAGLLDARGRAMRAVRGTVEWEQFALASALGDAVGLPVTLEHDYVCAALGESWTGRVPATSDLACLYAANGFGCGLLLDGDAYRGSSGNAGEIGHLVLAVDGPRCWCGGRGCLEQLAGPRTVVAQALDVPGLAARLGLSGAVDEVRRDFDAVAAAATAGDRECLQLVERSARHVAAAVLSLANVLDVDRVVLAGPAFAEAGPLYLRAAQDAVGQLSFMRPVHAVAIELSPLPVQSAAIGAATVALAGDLARPASAAARVPRGRR